MTPRAAPVHPLALISARMDGEITPGEARFLEAHLRMCPACQRQEAELRVIVSGLASLPVAAPPPKAVERLLIRLREQTEKVAPEPVAVAPALTTPKVEAVPRRRGLSWVALGTAAVALAAVALLSWLGMRTDPPIAPSPATIPQVIPTPPPAQSGPAAEAAETEEPVKSPAPLLESPENVEPPKPRRAPVASPPAPPRPAPVPPVEAAPKTPEPLPDAPAARPTEVRERELDATPVVLSPIYFKGNGRRLTTEARQHVEAVAEFLRQHPRSKLIIQGHTDNGRSSEKNLELGERRALAIARHLESLGIDRSRLRTVSYGADRRVDPGHDDSAADRNNRVEFALEE